MSELSVEYKKALEESSKRNRIKSFKRKLNHVFTMEDYENMLKAQDGKCAICSDHLRSSRETTLDHCHKERRVRGLLCRRCNIGIGQFQDNPDLLLNAIIYLKTH